MLEAKKNWIGCHVGEHNGRYNMAERKRSEERALRLRSAIGEVRQFQTRMNDHWVPMEHYCLGGCGHLLAR